MDLPKQDTQNKQHNAAPVSFDSVMQLASVIAQLMGDTQSKPSGSKEEEVDRYLQIFHKMKHSLFKGAVGPHDVED
ncbi:hypothetical protein IEQ34_011383 [Dendrobium chrysotoxum]|uniref:Uncharacterized protein n=1 Tax=Dendrobium chrysotoxum TaxID=161865 RepID=A0AAV7GXD2_DENCH|nr:hypothetical protein IEQ34_011383 [Dendrobium chrysotoxum]